MEEISEGAVVLRGFATSVSELLMHDIRSVASDSAFRRMETPGGFEMTVAMTNCGDVGWVSDRSGYRYDPANPTTQRPWPTMPKRFTELAAAAAESLGFSSFVPDACLVNRFQPRARLSLHQDKDERDFEMPIVSVSLGLPAVFLFGTDRRTDKPKRVPLESGDVVVWGGPARLAFHGIAPVAPARHALTGRLRFNLTLRKAL